jgi:glycerol uptake facilitator-like aquaporin
MARYIFIARDHNWIGHYGRTIVRGKYGNCPAGKYDPDRSDSLRFDYNFWPISGAHFKPAVTLSFTQRRDVTPRDAGLYIVVQITGAIFGVLAAHVMFEHPLIDPSTTSRSGIGQWVAEFIATFGLVGTILTCLKMRPEAVPMTVGLYITAAYWFTSSTSFANPAVTIARVFSDTFAGIAPVDVAAFVTVQLIAACCATIFFRWMLNEPIKS